MAGDKASKAVITQLSTVHSCPVNPMFWLGKLACRRNLRHYRLGPLSFQRAWSIFISSPLIPGWAVGIFFVYPNDDC